MGSLFIFFIIVFIMALLIVGWAMVLKVQKERKISEFKISYMRLSGEEQAAYQHYVQAEKTHQDVEIDIEKSKEIIDSLRLKVQHRRKELRVLIEQLRVIKSKINLLTGSSSKLDLELDRTKLTSEVKTRLMLNNEDKLRILHEKGKIQEKTVDLPYLAKESSERGTAWENLRKQVEQIESEFRALDFNAYKRFAESFIKSRSAEHKLDPERELVNMILLINNKKGLLYARNKEMAKDPTTESTRLVQQYEGDIKKLEAQLVARSKGLGISPKRLNELRNLFFK
ncbi:MAG: hypothetical protein A3F83_10130 [Candidatus Glassbacteria bacterium RIFCSPLOWO2_12_FULL_58_11]|uniref:DUF4041 domain-containing protein n=2 Tax=Candidatus Glassiibacteriota TaxID=1817805 RepID=A0A1F5Z348_9BACT|nr:MAG: hypothetical protein A2Z86_05235 [Candidatus Glassbacteria bacterium GWA2_58_10]OGG06888.1 MAG: hypothetical protein A3F83_10130 [Candidatus Glassbacteria bacterium RIFCSPLOWO2_12_FULL_58_11]